MACCMTHCIIFVPKMSCWGSHLPNFTFLGRSVIGFISSSHFQSTRCFNLENALINILRVSSGISVGFTMEPRLKKIKPSFPEPVRKSSKSCQKWNEVNYHGMHGIYKSSSTINLFTFGNFFAGLVCIPPTSITSGSNGRG